MSRSQLRQLASSTFVFPLQSDQQGRLHYRPVCFTLPSGEQKCKLSGQKLYGSINSTLLRFTYLLPVRWDWGGGDHCCNTVSERLNISNYLVGDRLIRRRSFVCMSFGL